MYKRHTLVTISLEGRERIFSELIQQGVHAEDCNSLLLPEKFTPDVARYQWCYDFTPALGIVRREEDCQREGYIPVGFCSWKRRSDQRLRIASFITVNEILKTTSPYEVLAVLKDNPEKYPRTITNTALAELVKLTAQYPFFLGVMGSIAQEIMTGYFYTSEISDIDIILSIPVLNESSIALLYRWFNQMMQIEQCFSIRIDTELELTNGYGVALKELFSDGHSVLGKGLKDVQLLSKKEIFADWDRLLWQLKP